MFSSHNCPCEALAQIEKDPYRMDRATRRKPTQEPETDCNCDFTMPFSSVFLYKITRKIYKSWLESIIIDLSGESERGVCFFEP